MRSTTSQKATMVPLTRVNAISAAVCPRSAMEPAQFLVPPCVPVRGTGELAVVDELVHLGIGQAFLPWNLYVVIQNIVMQLSLTVVLLPGAGIVQLQECECVRLSSPVEIPRALSLPFKEFHS